MLGESNALVDGEPVSDEVHEVLEDFFEMRVAGDGNRDVHACCDGRPDEAGDALGAAAHDLHGEGDGVDVGTVVCNDGEGEDNKAELSEAAEGREEDGGKETAGSRGAVALHIGVVAVVDGGRGHDGNA